MKTPALVIQQKRWSDNSAIVTLYTPEKGKISCIAKGALKPGSRLKGATELMSYVSVVISEKAGRDLQILSESHSEAQFNRIRSIPHGIPFLYCLAETLRLAFHSGESNELFFHHMVRLLDWSNENPDFLSAALINFFSGILKILGIEANIHVCSFCGKEDLERGYAFLLDSGRLICKTCRKKASYANLAPISVPVIQAWRNSYLFRRLIEEKPVVQANELSEFTNLISRYLSYHLSLPVKIQSLTLYQEMIV